MSEQLSNQLPHWQMIKYKVHLSYKTEICVTREFKAAFGGLYLVHYTVYGKCVTKASNQTRQGKYCIYLETISTDEGSARLRHVFILSVRLFLHLRWLREHPGWGWQHLENPGQKNAQWDWGGHEGLRSIPTWACNLASGIGCTVPMGTSAPAPSLHLRSRNKCFSLQKHSSLTTKSLNKCI